MCQKCLCWKSSLPLVLISFRGTSAPSLLCHQAGRACSGCWDAIPGWTQPWCWTLPMSLLWWVYTGTQVDSMATALLLPHLQEKGGKIWWKELKAWGRTGGHPPNILMGTNYHHRQDRLSIGRLRYFIAYHWCTTTLRNYKQTKNTIPPIQPPVTLSPGWNRRIGNCSESMTLFPLLLDGQSLPSLGPSCGMPSFPNASCMGP